MEREVFRYDFTESSNLATEERILQIINKNFKPVSIADIKTEFSNSSYEEVLHLVEKLVDRGELIIISVGLSAFENFNMFMTFTRYEVQTYIIVDYIKTRPNFTEAELIERFPLFFDYWVISSILTDLINKQFIKPSQERTDAWEWNSLNAI